jgi:hypothetical protein
MKSIIKPGVVVEYNCGKRALAVLVNDELIFTSVDGFMRLKEYDENLSVNLRSVTSQMWDIDKVYNVKFGCGFENMLKDDLLLPIWTRVREITLQEIADKFGVKPEQIRIKK